MPDAMAEPESNSKSNILFRYNIIGLHEKQSINRSITIKFKMGSIPKAAIDKAHARSNHLADDALISAVPAAGTKIVTPTSSHKARALYDRAGTKWLFQLGRLKGDP